MLFMKSQPHIWPFFRSHYLIKKKKKLVYCNVFGMVSPLVFGNQCLKEKKNLKLDMWRKIRQQLESNLESNWIFSQFWP